MKLKSAFSLIELSIVILIIGIIIAGVTQSSRLIDAFRLSTAKSLTRNSPVNSIDGLLLWLEPSLDESFLNSQTEDGSYITQWNDLNPQATTKNNFTKTSENTVTYKREAINHIPAVYFSGSAGTSVLTGTYLVKPSSGSFTLFTVFKLSESPTANTIRYVFYSGNASLNGFGYLKNNAVNIGERSAMFGGVAWNRTANVDSTTNAEIVTVKYDSTTVSMYVNNSSKALYDTTTMVTPIGSSYVGGYPAQSRSWSGYIAEIIVFDRALKENERADIERYLSKKYAITLN